MREHTTAERTRMLVGPRQYHAKLRVRNNLGTWKDLSTYLRAFRVSGNIDDAMSRGTFTLHKTTNLGSIAPLMVSSPMNLDAATFAPIVNTGNRLEFSIAVTDPFLAPGVTDWKVMFLGKIDRPDWPDRNELTIACRDIGAYLADNQVIETREYPAQLLEERIQQVITDNDAVATLVVPAPPDPAWVVKAGPLEGGDKPLLTELRNYAGQIAWDVRYEFTTGDNFELLLYEIDREKTVADATFGPGTYTNVPVMGFDDEGVRNWLRLGFKDSVSGMRSVVTYKAPTSIEIFGRRPIQIRFADTDAIDTFIEADRMGLGMLADLSIPPFDHGVQTKLFWPAQLGDLYEFLPNANHYDEAQQFALVAYEHSGAVDGKVFSCNSMLTVAGGPIGGYRRWLEKEGPQVDDDLDLPNPKFGAAVIGEVSALGGTAKDGRVHWEVEFDAATEFIVVWIEESEGSSVPTPDVGSEVETAITLFRPEGTEGQIANFATTIPFAIRPNFFARLIGAGFNKSNRRGPLATPPVVQAVDNDPPYLDGTLSGFSIERTPLGDGYAITATVAAIDPVAESWLFIERDNVVVFRLSLGTTRTGPFTFLDTGLLPGTAHTYKGYIYTRGQTGEPWGWLEGGGQPIDVGPRFSTNTPMLISTPAGKLVYVGIECEDPLADGVTLQRSGNFINWVDLDTIPIDAPTTVGGVLYVGNIEPAYYRLVSRAGAVYLTYTVPVYFPGDVTLPGGSGAPVLGGAVAMRGGIPRLILNWTCDNGDADYVMLQTSAPGAGLWSDVWPDGNASVAAGEWIGDAFTAADYRMFAAKNDGTILATSTVFEHDGEP